MADEPDPEQQFENRNESLRAAIDACAQVSRSELEQHGAKAEAARRAGVDDHKIHYALDRWDRLVEHRRNANTDPLDPEAVQASYDDETLRAMAGSEAVADGAGSVTVPIELSLDQCFRAMKLLPGDLGMVVFTQVLEKSDRLPADELAAIMRD